MFLAAELEWLVFPILFPSFIQFEEGVGQYGDSNLPPEAARLLARGILFVIMYFFLNSIVKTRTIKELLPPGGILLLQFLVVTIIYHFILPSTPEIEELVIWATTFLYALCYLGSGFYSVKKASQILEGNE